MTHGNTCAICLFSSSLLLQLHDIFISCLCNLFDCQIVHIKSVLDEDAYLQHVSTVTYIMVFPTSLLFLSPSISILVPLFTFSCLSGCIPICPAACPSLSVRPAACLSREMLCLAHPMSVRLPSSSIQP